MTNNFQFDYTIHNPGSVKTRTVSDGTVGENGSFDMIVWIKTGASASKQALRIKGVAYEGGYLTLMVTEPDPSGNGNVLSRIKVEGCNHD